MFLLSILTLVLQTIEVSCLRIWFHRGECFVNLYKKKFHFQEFLEALAHVPLHHYSKPDISAALEK